MKKVPKIGQDKHYIDKKKKEEKAKNNVVSPLKVKIYKTPQAYGKALKKSLTALLNSPR